MGWKSCFFATPEAFAFQRQPDLLPNTSGHVDLTVEPDCVVSLTTTAGQSKAGNSSTLAPNKPAPFPIPYSDIFDTYQDDAMARYFSDQTGSFSVNASAAALQQRIHADPSVWGTGWGLQDSVQPISIIGEYRLDDVVVG